MTTKAQLKFKTLTNQVFEGVSYYMKPFTTTTYSGMGMHQHQYFEIMYAHSGSFVLQIFSPDKKTQKKEIIHAGQFVLLDGFTFHRVLLNNDADCFIYNIELNPREPVEFDPFGVNSMLKINYEYLFKRTNLKQIADNTEGYMILNDSQQVSDNLQEMILLLTAGITNADEALAVKLAEAKLFNEISKCLVPLSVGTLSYIRKTNAYILENYKRNINIDEIVQKIGLSKAYLQRQYKKHTGKTILEAINSVRAKHAAELLVRTDLTINKIAERVGFNNKNQFNYEFKMIYGDTPSNYRKSNISTIDHHYDVYDSNSIPFPD